MPTRHRATRARLGAGALTLLAACGFAACSSAAPPGVSEQSATTSGCGSSGSGSGSSSGTGGSGGGSGAAVFRVAAGQSAPYTDSSGNVWSADEDFSGGMAFTSPTAIGIASTSDAPLFNSERFGADSSYNPASFGYSFPVPNGSYTVNLEFAEIYGGITGPGQRQFNVSINGKQVLSNFDIYAAAGGADTAVVQSFAVDVTGGTIAIQLDPGAAQNPKVDAIEILSTSGSPPPSGGGSGGGSGSSSGGSSGGGSGGVATINGFVGGTNLSGAEFGSAPGNYGTDYIYPPHSDVDYFVGKGFKIMRVPFLWERMQPTLGQPLDSAELGRLTDIVSYIASKGAYALVDPHNYARYGGNVIGASSVSTADFADFWSRLAQAFASNGNAVFGLMNEPHDMDTNVWLGDANAAIAAIRAAGAKNVIFVPGNSWTGAHSWSDGGSSANATVMLGVQDPLDNYAFEVHQYLDSDFSGTHPDCQSTTIGSQSLQGFTQWLQANHLRGFLGEFGAANNATCLAALEDMLSNIDQHRDLWVGWTWWSAGPWWGSYMFSIEPSNGADAPQMATLVKHL